MISALILSDLLIKPGVLNTRFGAEVGFQRLNFAILNESHNGVIRSGVLDVAENTRTTGTNFHAGGFKPARDPVITHRAFIGRVRFRIKKPTTVRAGLHTKAAAD